MVDIVCICNLDLDKNEKWPTKLEARPVVGDYIESSHIWSLESGGCISLSLRVMGLTWKASISNCWYLEVELGLPRCCKGVSEFDLWYKKTRKQISLDEYRLLHRSLTSSSHE